MFINRHIEQQMYLFICQDGIQKFTTRPKCHNICKQVGSLAFWPSLVSLTQQRRYLIADIILDLPECQRHLVWVYLRPYTFDGAMTDCHTISILMIVVMPGTVTAIIHSTLPSTYNTVNRGML